jgi:hypothetical protein
MDLTRRLDGLIAARGAPAQGVHSAPVPAAGQREPQPDAPAPERVCPPRELPGGQEYECSAGRCWRVDTGFDAICATHRIDAAQLQCLLVYLGGPTPVTIDPVTAVVLDIETGGFSGTPLFLAGLVRLDKTPLCVTQFLARDYPEEAAVLEGLAAMTLGCTTWITFNGKSFDAPFVADRATQHRILVPTPQLHFDLLHAARRTWRSETRDCRLSTLEQHILGRRRDGDVPSRDIPDLFHYFIRTGNAGPLRPVLAHNRLDLVTATELLLRLAVPDRPGCTS